VFYVKHSKQKLSLRTLRSLYWTYGKSENKNIACCSYILCHLQPPTKLPCLGKFRTIVLPKPSYRKTKIQMQKGDSRRSNNCVLKGCLHYWKKCFLLAHYHHHHFLNCPLSLSKAACTLWPKKDIIVYFVWVLNKVSSKENINININSV
jgi:hypothetical protein